ncbi:recombinase family protein [Acidovorax sp. D4N7]|uniref:recombinase family protein n=1 Tax=Comamonas endophytica TaxID=2949090 RepID=UPI001E63E89A|nr:recombinase family protein [Acidovorax sp. D4N7]
MLIGYARVSTQDQDTALQLDALNKAGCEKIFQEKASGASRRGRQELARCLASLGRGDVLIVYKIDRIARSLFDLLEILRQLERVGATIKSVTEPLDTTNSMGVFVVQILGAVAQLERSMIRERSIAGQLAARERGRLPGRNRSLSAEEEDALVTEYQTGKTTYKGLGVKYGISASAAKRAVYRAVKSGDYLKRMKC